MGKYCSTCIHWKKVAPQGVDSLGQCTSGDVSVNVALDSKTTLGEDDTLWTSKYFGCVYWRDNHGVLIDINEIVKDQMREDGYNI